MELTCVAAWGLLIVPIAVLLYYVIEAFIWKKGPPEPDQQDEEKWWNANR